MAKALKPLIIIQLLLSGGALYLAVTLFQQREVLKYRTQTLESAADNFANSIRHEFDVTALKNHENMQEPLIALATAGKETFDDLQDTKQDLENTRQDLEQTQLELANTQSQLSDANEEIAQLSDDLSQREAEIAEANSKIGDLESETASLKSEIENYEEKLTTLEDEYAELEIQYGDLDKAYQQVVKQLQGNVKTPDNLVGEILLVNPEWNFCIINLGNESGLGPDAEMLIHRDDKLVGRIKISSVGETVAVAEILTDWSQTNARKGDFVISPGKKASPTAIGATS